MHAGEVMSGEAATFSVTNRINKLRFIHGKNRFLTSTIRQLLYCVLI